MMPITEVVQPADVQAIAGHAEQDAISFVEAHKIDVTDVPSLERAVSVRDVIGAKQKEIVAKLAKPKKWAHGLHAWFCELERTALAPLNKLDAYEAQQIRAFKQQQDRERQQREREEADRQRRDRETRAAAEAAALERDGETAMAAAVVQEAISAPTPVVTLPDVTRGVAKFVRRYKWKYAGGPEYVATTPPDVVARTLRLIPREFTCVDEIKMGAYARSMKGTGVVPGIEFFHSDDPVR